MRVKLHFVHRRLDARVAQNQLELRDGHIGRADMPDELQIDQLFHRAPGLHVVLMNVGLGVRAARADVATRRMVIGERPMHEEHVEIIETQVGERLAARGDHVLFSVLVVPYLRGDPELLALDPAPDDRFERGADGVLVSVHRRAIEVPVADRGRALDRRGDLGRRHTDRSRMSRAPRPASWRRCTIASAGSPPGRQADPVSPTMLMPVPRLRMATANSGAQRFLRRRVSK